MRVPRAAGTLTKEATQNRSLGEVICAVRDPSFHPSPRHDCNPAGTVLGPQVAPQACPVPAPVPCTAHVPHRLCRGGVQQDGLWGRQLHGHTSRGGGCGWRRGLAQVCPVPPASIWLPPGQLVGEAVDCSFQGILRPARGKGLCQDQGTRAVVMRDLHTTKSCGVVTTHSRGLQGTG